MMLHLQLLNQIRKKKKRKKGRNNSFRNRRQASNIKQCYCITVKVLKENLKENQNRGHSIIFFLYFPLKHHIKERKWRKKKKGKKRKNERKKVIEDRKEGKKKRYKKQNNT